MPSKHTSAPSPAQAKALAATSSSSKPAALGHAQHPAKSALATTEEPLRAGAASLLPKSSEAVKADVIYLGIDTHADRQVVVVQVDATTPKPAQRFSVDGLLKFAKQQQSKAHRVVACYEAGPCGYTLYRELKAMGVETFVVRPKKWDEFSKNVKTDARDARALCEALERYSKGNTSALSIIRVPTVAEEQARAITRQRDALVGTRKQVAAQGRSAVLCAQHRVRMKGRWWKPRAWAKWERELSPAMLALLAPLKAILLTMDEQIDTITKQIEAKAKANPARKNLPKGLGELTQEIIANEIGDWHRFKNRRQVSSFTGLCPMEYSSGGKRLQGSVNKHGNPLLRTQLCEAVWRLVQFQPGWIRLKRGSMSELAEGSSGAKKRKQRVAALARMLAVDLWRLNTGRTTLEALGFIAAA